MTAKVYESRTVERETPRVASTLMPQCMTIF